MKSSTESQLPTFVLGDSYDTAIGPETDKEQRVIEVTCPRSTCGRTFVVVIKDWWKVKRRTEVRSRPCPYCFRAAWRPQKPDK